MRDGPERLRREARAQENGAKLKDPLWLDTLADQWDKDRAEIEELREYRDKNEAIGCETCYPFRHPEAARKPLLNPTGDR